MPDEYERLRRRIELGLAAAEELQRKLEAAEREARRERKRKLRLINGGLIWGAAMAGVEWFRHYRRTVGALAVSGLVVTGGVIAERPDSPASDPPESVKPPSAIRPSAAPSVRPTTALTPRRTSPPRTQLPARIPPPVGPTSTKPTKEPTQVPTRRPTKTPTSTPTKSKPIVSLPVTSTIIGTPTVPVSIATPDTCSINLLGVHVCLPRD